MANLFVIEAPGKVRALEAILERIGAAAKVQATKGHVYEMPPSLDRLGIDNGFREFERKPRDIEVIGWLRRAASVADHVYIATDADAEGDVIAWDVAEIIKDLCREPMRVRLKGMDDDSVREAINSCAPVRKADAVAGRTRAIVDRLIGATFSTDGVAVGRVGTALLGLVQRDRPTTMRLNLVAPASDRGRPFLAEIDVREPLTRDVAERLAGLDLPAIGAGDRAAIAKRPGNTGDIMVRAGDALDMSPTESSRSMQRLYESGRMSYPRAGSRGMSPTVSRKIAAILKKAGYTNVSEAGYAQKSEADVHDAPYPIGAVNPNHDPTRLGDDEGLRTMVARDLVRTGQSHVSEKGLGDEIEAFLVGKGFAAEVAKLIADLPWRREVGPRYPGQDSWPESQLVERRADVVLLEHAVRAGLGRPSTWANHIETFMSRDLVKSDLSITLKGRAWIAKSPDALLDPRLSAAIENACERVTEEMLANPRSEPWEINAARIVGALPGPIRDRLFSQIKDVPVHPRVDPVEAYAPLVEDMVSAHVERMAQAGELARQPPG